jgi:hypothetical protein
MAYIFPVSGSNIMSSITTIQGAVLLESSIAGRAEAGHIGGPTKTQRRSVRIKSMYLSSSRSTIGSPSIYGAQTPPEIQTIPERPGQDQDAPQSIPPIQPSPQGHPIHPPPPTDPRSRTRASATASATARRRARSRTSRSHRRAAAAGIRGTRANPSGRPSSRYRRLSCPSRTGGRRG